MYISVTAPMSSFQMLLADDTCFQGSDRLFPGRIKPELFGTPCVIRLDYVLTRPKGAAGAEHNCVQPNCLEAQLFHLWLGHEWDVQTVSLTIQSNSLEQCDMTPCRIPTNRYTSYNILRRAFPATYTVGHGMSHSMSHPVCHQYVTSCRSRAWFSNMVTSWRSCRHQLVALSQPRWQTHGQFVFLQTYQL